MITCLTLNKCYKALEILGPNTTDTGNELPLKLSLFLESRIPNKAEFEIRLRFTMQRLWKVFINVDQCLDICKIPVTFRLKLKSVWNIDSIYSLILLAFSTHANLQSPVPERSICPVLFLENKVENKTLTVLFCLHLCFVCSNIAVVFSQGTYKVKPIFWLNGTQIEELVCVTKTLEKMYLV